MKKPILVAVGAAVLTLLPASLEAQAIRFHGVSASATSVGPNGEPHGIPAGATSPTFDNQIGFVNQRNIVGGVHFNQRTMAVPQGRGHHHNQRIIAVPVYIPGYSLPYYSYEAEPVVEEKPAEEAPRPEPPARTIFERRSSTIRENQSDEADDSRYGEHYLDSREERRKQDKAEGNEEKLVAKAKDQKPPAEETVDSLPNTVLIFKDGHRSEIRDYAIVGDNLFDLGTAHVMKKIPLAMLDLSATHKENEQNGVDFHLP